MTAETASACAEQSGTIQQVNQAINGLDKVTQTNGAKAAESLVVAERLMRMAEDLRSAVAYFHVAEAEAVTAIEIQRRRPMRKGAALDIGVAGAAKVIAP